jgi:ssDNA-binding Zn-finger/Zn-ribbon topoisomerase 1
MREGEACPTCGDTMLAGKLIERVNSKKRTRFLGCTNFPACDYTYSPSLRRHRVHSYEEDCIDVGENPYDDPYWDPAAWGAEEH